MMLKPVGTKLLVTPYRRAKQWGGKVELLEKQRNVLMGDDHWFWVVAVGEGVAKVLKKDAIKVKDRVLLAKDHESLEYLTDGSLRAFVNLNEVLAFVRHTGFTPVETPPAKPH
jgi:co-chaperonin GroES (HSP10)